MANHTFVDYFGPGAKELCDLHGIGADLRSAMWMCDSILKHFEGGPHPEGDLVETYSVAVVVRYCRAFATGVRKIKGALFLGALSDEQREDHDQIRALRDKHIAHSVNAFEETHIQARFVEERVREEGISGIGAAHYRVIGLAADDFRAVHDLCSTLIPAVDAEIRAREEALLAEIRAQPLDEVLAAGSSAPVPDYDKVGTPRKRG